MARLRTLVVPVAGAIALVAGFVLLLWSRPTVGWFAYAPLATQAYYPSFPDYPLAVGLLVLGVALLAGWIGFRLGRRPQR
ncbi:hypothetical protein PYV02_09960 [Leifsonia sp. H3M29-4]|uniref:hypothetical protein n=1 Tax=Salinibacterium metalliresistens TaxID=3031321 RepID=UPI0023DBB372|nr:hypothetical protein [Salinibacterium metalliresistens]MDF1479406.1 hypothetical protein [Salinibacterium metalliresistens]